MNGQHFFGDDRSLASDTTEAPSQLGIIRRIGWLETVCGIVLLLLITVSHVQMMLHAGALWRDEVQTFHLASLESLGTIVDLLQFDSFPILWILILRVWIFAGLGSETGLRILGMLVGLAGCLSLIWVCRLIGSRIPILALALFGFCPVVYLYGNSLRAAGCGMVLLFLTLGFFWKALQDPSPRNVAFLGIFSILSVHCVYYNSILLFAMGMGGVAVGLRQRDRRKVLMVLGIGTAAAVTLLPYWNVVSRTEWGVLIQAPFTVSQMIGKFRETLELAGSHIFWIWLVILATAIPACLWRYCAKAGESDFQAKDRALFLLTTLAVAVVGYGTFLKVLSYPTQYWYYLAILAMLAVLLDSAIQILAESRPAVRVIRLVGVLIILSTTCLQTWNAVHTRMTNIDLSASVLNKVTTANDLIVVNPWFLGISFDHYYQGTVPWVTVPPVADHRFHRYDLFMEKMTEDYPLAAVHAKIRKTLEEGNRVWVLGWIPFPKDAPPPAALPPAPHSAYGWSEFAYESVWWQQTAHLILRHAKKAEIIQSEYSGAVQPFENIPLLVFHGRP